MQKPLLIAVSAVVALVLVAGGYLLLQPKDAYQSPALLNAAGSDIGGPFELTSNTGVRVTSDALIDKPTLLYFGYTFCPDVCPIDTQVMSDAAMLLDERGIEVTPVFISVDPERDTPEALTYFVEGLHPRMVGLTGTPEEIKSAADAYKVFYQRVDQPDSAIGYLMNHTAYIYLMVPGQGVIAVFRNGFPPEQIAQDVEAVLGRL